MARMLVAALAALLVLGGGTAHAQGSLAPSLSVDQRFAPLGGGIAREDLTGDATDLAGAVAVHGDRIYTVGQARVSATDDKLGITALRSDGTYDPEFSGDGKLMLPNATCANLRPCDVVVLPDGDLRLLGAVDADPGTETNLNVVVLALTPDGNLDPGFGTGGVVSFPVGPDRSADFATRMAIAPDGRIAITGSTNIAAKDDTFVSLREPNGAPVAGFGTAGVRILNRGGGTLNDRGVDVEFRPGGGIVALLEVETNPSAEVNDYVTVLHAFDAAGNDDGRFAGSGDLPLPVGQPDTNPGGLLVHGGRLWVSGTTKVGQDKDAFIARLRPDGGGFESRRYDVRGTAIDASQPVVSAGSDLDVVPGITPTLVVTGSINYNSRPYWAAAAFSRLDGPLDAALFGDLLVPTDEWGSIVGIAASPDGWAAVAGTLINTSESFDTSFGTARLLVDADKACDLALEIVEPLEITMPPGGSAPVTLKVTNEGTKVCAGALSAPAPYAFEGGATAFQLAPGAAATTTGLRLRYAGPRRRDDVVTLRVHGAGDPNAKNDERAVKVLFDYCDLALEAGKTPSVAPVEGSRRYEFEVRNHGTVPCRAVRVTVTGGGKRAGTPRGFTLRPGRSATADLRAVVAAGGRTGKRAALTFRAVARNDAVRGNETATLAPKLVAVGDSNIRRAGAHGFRGTARGAGARKLRRVEVALRRKGARCRWLASRSGRLGKARPKGKCGARTWVRARGKRHWRVRLPRALPPGRYVLTTRAVTGSGFREGRFSIADRNKRNFEVP